MRTATEVGGDYYDFHMEKEPYFGVFGDVSGHGLKSGLVMMMAEVAFNTLMTDDEIKKQPLNLLYQKINSTLFTNIQNRLAKKSNIGSQYNHMYMTFRMFRFDDSGQFEMFGNDHAMPFVCRAETGEIEPINSTGFLLGIIKNATMDNKGYSFKLNPGDILCLYSDGITEAEGKSTRDIKGIKEVRDMFGEERLYEVIKQNRTKNPEEIIKALVNAVDEYMVEQDDDITISIIKKK
jgi:serine phosphatase RsbU (regulator of sigma subunit)